MKKWLILFIIILPIFLNSASIENRGTQTDSIIKPGIKDILLGKTHYEIIFKLILKKYNSLAGVDDAPIFSDFLSMEEYIERFAPSIKTLREKRKWNYYKFISFLNDTRSVESFSRFVEPVTRTEYEETEYPLKFKRWKRYRIMLKDFNVFVRRVDLAFYNKILYYAKFYVVDKYRFDDTYSPDSVEIVPERIEIDRFEKFVLKRIDDFNHKKFIAQVYIKDENAEAYFLKTGLSDTEKLKIKDILYGAGYFPNRDDNFMRRIFHKFRLKYGTPMLLNNFEYRWYDIKTELILDGKNSSLTYINRNTDGLVVRYLKNVAIILSRIQKKLTDEANYVDHNLSDF